MSTNLPVRKADHSEGLIFCVRRILYPAVNGRSAEARTSPRLTSRGLTLQKI